MSGRRAILTTMAHQMRTSTPLDLKVLEDRTQAIGRELFARARREHEHLSVLNRWTARVLSWCLSDPELKSRVLQFIDVLPNLRDPREIARHVREYFPPDFRMPSALRIGAQLARPGLLTQGALAALVHQLVEQVARQFIAESRPEGATRVIRELAARGTTCSLDILGEQVLSEAEADGYTAACGALLREAAAAYASLTGAPPLHAGRMAGLSIKPSALTPRFDPISPERSVEQAARRAVSLWQVAEERQALLYLDMEQYELRDITLLLAQHLLQQPLGAHAPLGIVIQAYLQDAEAVVDRLLAWLAEHGRRLTIRLVKGAYWDAELAQASQAHWPVPVHQDKALTDLAFERLTRRLLGASSLVTTAIASHNVRSVAHAMAVAEATGLPKAACEFQLLYGMGDALQAAIVSLGYPVRIYTPIGHLIPGMAYLVRRILENSANESFLRHDFFQEQDMEQLLRAPVVSREPGPAVVASGEPPRRGGWRGGEPIEPYATEPARRRMREAIRSVTSEFGRAYPLLLGSSTVQDRPCTAVQNPARTSELLGRVAQGSEADAHRAVEQAAAAQPAWARTPLKRRIAALAQAAQLMRRQRALLSAWEVFEVGKPWREADADVVEAIDYLEYYSDGMERLAGERHLQQPLGERNELRYLPRGVAAVIAPWNFPIAILTGMASAALVTGHAVILKPAEQSPITGALVARLLREAGIPDGVVQYLPGAGEQVGAALVRHPQVHTVLFTGSKAVGLSIINACAVVQTGQRFVKHVVAEMGGKNAIIVDSDADLDAAIHGAIRSAFGYSGQKCSAASRLIVHRDVYELFITRLIAAVDRLAVGDPADPSTDLGPLIDADARQRLEEAAAHAQQSARVLYRFPASRLPAHGHFVGPMLVGDVRPEDRLAREELFGPLVCVFRADSFEESLALANDTDYALTGGVYTRSPSHIERAIQAFDVGNLYINRPITGAVVGRQPFGGHRLSGLGMQAGGPDYLAQLLLPKTVSINTTRHGMPLE